MYYKKCNFCTTEYCDELFHDTYPNTKSSILYETKNFYICIDGYPIYPNHLLIVPRDHKLSFQALNKSYAKELEDLINNIKSLFNDSENFIMFEHGDNENKIENIKKSVSSVIHAHMQFIPGIKIEKKDLINFCFLNNENKLTLKNNINYEKYFFKKENKEKFILDYLKDDLPTNEPYLFFYFNNETGENMCIPQNIVDGEIPSQYFRKIMAIIRNPNVKNPFYNWKISNEVALSQNDRIEIINDIFKVFEKHK